MGLESVKSGILYILLMLMVSLLCIPGQMSDNPCQQSPCLNGGTCTSKDGTFNCTCTRQWTGEDCSEDVDECDSKNPCLNAGTCVNTNGSFTCQCINRFTGQTCDKDHRVCDSLPCQNGGICSGGHDQYICTCIGDFEGFNCEKAKPLSTEPCKNSSCLNGGRCIGTVDRFECICTIGYTGGTCIQDVNECDVEPARCENGGKCINSVGSYRCVCLSGWTGDFCSQVLVLTNDELQVSFLIYILTGIGGLILLTLGICLFACFRHSAGRDDKHFNTRGSDEDYPDQASQHSMSRHSMASKHSLGGRRASRQSMGGRHASRHSVGGRHASRHSVGGRHASRHSIGGRSASRHSIGGRSASRHSIGGRSGSKQSLAGRYGDRRGVTESRQNLAMIQSLHDMIRAHQMQQMRIQQQPGPDILALARAIMQQQAAAPKPDYADIIRTSQHNLALKQDQFGAAKPLF